MLNDTLVLACFGLLATIAVTTSILILARGRFYHSLKPDSRPRRWVLFSLLFLFGVFLVWFPIWYLWPHSLVARVLLFLFSVTFFCVGMSLKWFGPFIDRVIKRSGRPLR